MTRRHFRVMLLAVAGLSFTASLVSAQLLPRTVAEPPAKLEIRAKPIEAFDPREPQRTQFGPLVFRGGLELTSPNKHFGGLSGIRVAASGSFLSITDKAHWLRGRIVYRGNAPVGIADAEVAPMLYSDGRPITARGWYDTEALSEDGGYAYVALERVHRILKFDYGKRGLLARATLVPAPPELRKLPSNKGIECLVAAPKGTPVGGALIAISERGLDANKNIRGFLIGGPKPGVFAVKPSDDFDVVDCVLTPDSNLLILERHFSWRRGVAMRLRRVALSDVVPGAVLEGSTLISADMGFQIDNMEGMSVHRSANGETVLTLVSDDNFSIIQRTILLQFTLLDQ
ncbi:MAG: esterase-like activity of phytase family protein [Pseudorhodoplanes sp.]|uniref:esterase-like activity of phytase family protein n=1 Tax=Pseudorhodoplanes sp. TaxID=1934341 RepID=UPI003D102A8B